MTEYISLICGMPNKDLKYTNESTYGMSSNDLRHSGLECNNNLHGYNKGDVNMLTSCYTQDY